MKRVPCESLLAAITQLSTRQKQHVTTAFDQRDNHNASNVSQILGQHDDACNLPKEWLPMSGRVMYFSKGQQQWYEASIVAMAIASTDDGAGFVCPMGTLSIRLDTCNDKSTQKLVAPGDFSR